MPKLNKRTVEGLEPRETDYIVFDDDVHGFGVRVLPSGQLTYLAQYRSGGRTRRVKIGRHGVLTAEQARGRAKEILGAVAGGDNPAAAISAQRTAPTVAQVCDRFWRDYVLERCKPTTQREYSRSLELFIKPAIGAFKIGDVSRPDIAQLHHGMRDRPYQANRTLGVISKLFNLCEVWGLRPDGSNPCRHVQKYTERKRETFLSDAQLSHLGEVLDACQADGSESPYVVAAFKLLILTGCRLSEIQFLKWEYVRGAYMHLPDSKTGARRIPLPPQALELLESLGQIAAPPIEQSAYGNSSYANSVSANSTYGKNPYVIAGEVEGQAVTDLQKPWRRIRKRAGLEHVRIHDLRHTYASNAVMQGVPIAMVGKLLGHTQIQTTMRYAHLADDPVRKAAAQVAGSLASSLGAPGSANKLTSDSEPLKPVLHASVSGNVVEFPHASATRK